MHVMLDMLSLISSMQNSSMLSIMNLMGKDGVGLIVRKYVRSLMLEYKGQEHLETILRIRM